MQVHIYIMDVPFLKKVEYYMNQTYTLSKALPNKRLNPDNKGVYGKKNQC